MIKIYVLDTNTLISAHLLPNSISRKAFNKALEEGALVHSSATFNEFVEVFTRPKFDKYVSTNIRLNAVKLLERSSQLVDVSIKVNDCRDPKDNKFLELALTVKSNCIITGDKDLLVLHPFQEISILTAAEFLVAK